MSSQLILKWGNSLGFRLPAEIAKQMNVAEGAKVNYRLEGRRLIIEPAQELPPFTLADLKRAVRKGKLAPDPLGAPMGKEHW